jgi:hypothetical protein
VSNAAFYGIGNAAFYGISEKRMRHFTAFYRVSRSAVGGRRYILQCKFTLSLSKSRTSLRKALSLSLSLSRLPPSNPPLTTLRATPKLMHIRVYTNYYIYVCMFVCMYVCMYNHQLSWPRDATHGPSADSSPPAAGRRPSLAGSGTSVTCRLYHIISYNIILYHVIRYI